MRDYQLEYASGRPQMYDKASRERKANRMVKTLEVHFGKGNLSKLTLLDIGSSTGIIDNYLSKYFKKVVGIDIDQGGVDFARKKFAKRKNLKFKIDDAMGLSFKDNSFDVVICTHIYEHVPDSRKLFKEIYRVLKPNGVCYLAALNKWWPIEPHYNLPFLSWVPKDIANMYLKLLSGKGPYYENILSYWDLRKITNRFTVEEYTDSILKHPEKYGYGDIFKTSLTKNIAKLVAPFSKYMAPTFFWLLVKKED